MKRDCPIKSGNDRRSERLFFSTAIKQSAKKIIGG